VRHHHDAKGAQGFERIAGCVTLGNILTHSDERPEILKSPEFASALELLDLSHDNLKRWAERLRDHQGLVSGMSRLPI
jgi:hypothetical protein